MIFDVVAKLVSKQVSMQQLAGPVVSFRCRVWSQWALAAILDFMALIGINLAVLNLLPLVITDAVFFFSSSSRRCAVNRWPSVIKCS